MATDEREAMAETFRIGLTRDFLRPDGTVAFGDIGLGMLEGQPGIEFDYLADNAVELGPDQVRGYDALAVLAPRVSAKTLEGADRLAIVARYGVGYDTIDVPACTAKGVALTITPDAVRRTVATVVMTYVLSLSHRLLEQDRATRAGEGWSRKLDLMGYGLIGKKLGLIGLGNIGSEVVKLARPFDLVPIASDPYVHPDRAAELGVELVDLETLLRTADYVVVLCALTPETRGMLSAGRLALMKPTAFLINAARGPIVDQRALYEALRDRRIRGAGLDVFEQEPIDPADPILALDNVTVSPHALAWTDEWAYASGQSAIRNMLAVAAGQNPTYVVNREVLESPLFQDKLRRYAGRLES
jgi:phosphoglycerate dehydrogenase-like enzyme